MLDDGKHRLVPVVDNDLKKSPNTDGSDGHQMLVEKQHGTLEIKNIVSGQRSAVPLRDNTCMPAPTGQNLNSRFRDVLKVVLFLFDSGDYGSWVSVSTKLHHCHGYRDHNFGVA